MLSISMKTNMNEVNPANKPQDSEVLPDAYAIVSYLEEPAQIIDGTKQDDVPAIEEWRREAILRRRAMLTLQSHEQDIRIGRVREFMAGLGARQKELRVLDADSYRYAKTLSMGQGPTINDADAQIGGSY